MGNCPIRWNILVQILLRVLQRAGWRLKWTRWGVDGAEWWLKWAGWRWMELGGDGWSWVEVGARFSNTHFILDTKRPFTCGELRLFLERCKVLKCCVQDFSWSFIPWHLVSLRKTENIYRAPYKKNDNSSLHFHFIRETLVKSLFSPVIQHTLWPRYLTGFLDTPREKSILVA